MEKGVQSPKQTFYIHKGVCMGNWAGIFVPGGIPGSKFSLDPIFPKGKFSAKRGGGCPGSKFSLGPFIQWGLCMENTSMINCKTFLR